MNQMARGHDKVGRTWRVSLPAADHELWSTRRGQRPNLLLRWVHRRGRDGAGTWILALSFDEAGRPVPFYITTYDGPDAKGLRNLLQLGPADQVMLQTTWFEDQRRDDTARATLSLALTAGKACTGEAATGCTAASRFPIFERYELMPGAESKRVPPPDHEGSSSLNWETIRSPACKRPFSTGAEETLTQPGLGCELGAMDVVVADGPSGREIDATFSDSGRPGGLLQEIVQRHSPVTITGLNRGRGTEACYAMVVWSKF